MWEPGANVVDRFYTVAVTVGETTTAVNLGEYFFWPAQRFSSVRARKHTSNRRFGMAGDIEHVRPTQKAVR